MGLSASQARLLTITARKSDCEYESMRLSHEKIALSRNMEQVSAEYDKAMSQTKLVYDYYGTGSEQTPLAYNLLMTPSQLNNYTPMPVTDSSGRVVLDDRLAKAAKDAGIPQEGLDGLPSSDLRNAFIDSLASTGYISQVQADNIKKTTYNQAAGVGDANLVNVNTTTGTLQDLIESVSNEYFDFGDFIGDNSNIWGDNPYVFSTELINHPGTGVCYDKAANKLSFADILNGNYMIVAEGEDNYNNLTVDGGLIDILSNLSIWECMFQTFESKLNTGDEYTQAALAYARRQIEDMVTNLGAGQDNGEYGVGKVPASKKHNAHENMGKNIHDNFGNNSGGATGWRCYGDKKESDGPRDAAHDAISQDVVGLNGIYAHDDNGDHDNDGKSSFSSINISTMFKSYLTYFAQYMEGLDNSAYNVGHTKSGSNLIDDMFQFTMVTDVDTTGNNLLIAAFWDTLFNQICTKGWVENDNVNDAQYLQESFKNGNMYMSTLADDGFYYQGNYATNTFVKEVTDEEGIAQAESRYQREKAKINNKENILDMKMKNLDTEISSLSTEYDTIKSVIQKNIEKSFKRYQA